MLKIQCCSEPKCSTNLRNRYFQGKRLTPASFETEQWYTLLRRRMINQTIHGMGVVAGYSVPTTGKLVIGPGFALDDLGRELIQLDSYEIPCDLLLPLDSNGKPSNIKWNADEDLLLSVHYAEELVGPTTVNSPCACDRSEWDYVCESIRYSVRPFDNVDANDSQLDCSCDDRTFDPNTPTSSTRGSCCLNHHVLDRDWKLDADMCEIEEGCGIVHVDLKNSVGLAKIRIRSAGPASCPRFEVVSSETCGVRPLVKHNHMLFDLIRGCDLTGIASTSWEEWEPEVERKVFVDSFAKGDATPDKPFEVRFTKRVQVSSLRPHAFVITVLFGEGEGGWWESYRVPVTALTPIDEQNGTAIGFQVAVPPMWVEDALYGYTRFDKHDARIELEVRGDLILDCNGQAVDANGNGTPGGTSFASYILKSEKPQSA